MTPTLPIVGQVRVELDACTRRRLEKSAKRLLAQEPALNETGCFGPRVQPGLVDGPALFFEDHSGVALLSSTREAALEYRSFLLARDEDIFLMGGYRVPEFETYCRSALKLGAGRVISLESASTAPGVPLSVRCANDPPSRATLCRAAAQHGNFNIIPYMGTGNGWRLAAVVAAQSGAAVCVAAPPPRLTRRVNDKLWFLERVREVLGKSASPLTCSVFGPVALASRLRGLASQFARVVVKVPDSAGSYGNLMIRSEDIARRPLRDIWQMILSLLGDRGWRASYPLLVGVWEYPVLATPSVNFWIPAREEGPPRVEGVFGQAVSGDNGEFVGAEPCTLPKELEHRLLWESTCLAEYFQMLGYFGQCGFDSILIGDSLENASIHWIECNGRWGGVSIPITVANRLIGNWATKFTTVIQQSNLKMPPRSFQSVLTMLRGCLFRSPVSKEGVVLLAPGRLVNGSGLNAMVIAGTKEEARAQLATVMGLLQSADGTVDRKREGDLATAQ